MVAQGKLEDWDRYGRLIGRACAGFGDVRPAESDFIPGQGQDSSTAAESGP